MRGLCRSIVSPFFSSVKAGSSDLIRGLIFNEGSQRRTRGEGGYWLVDLCEMAVASPDKNRGEGERLQLDSSGGSSFVSVATAPTTLTPCFPPSYQSGQLSRPAPPGVVTPLVFSLLSLSPVFLS